MPELPEVEIIKQSLEKSIQSKKITKILIHNRNLRFKTQKNLNQILKGKKILKLNRRSKYLILHFSKDIFLIIHFGMSGTLHLIKKKNCYQTNLSFYHSRNLPKKHNHIELIFSGFKVIYNDPRRFGFFYLFNSKDKLDFFFNKIGPEPLGDKFNYHYLKKKIKYKSKNIKNILLDQNIISGIGNIYASEILFYSKINPQTKGKEIKNIEIKKIIKWTKYILTKAINKGGSSIKNFKNVKGKIGTFQKEFKVYDQEGKKCPRIKCKGVIQKIIITNRSTFFCKFCQN